MANCKYFIGVLLLILLNNIVHGQPNNGTECSEVTTCSGRGQCQTDDAEEVCLCDDGYTTYPEPQDPTSINATFCSYKQKEQLTGFLLTFFLGGAGAGRFYIENWLLAGLKLGFCVGFPCIICCLVCCCGIGAGLKDNFDGGGEGFLAATGFMGCCCICIYTLGVFAWCLADIILFGIGDVQDGNGVDLYQNL